MKELIKELENVLLTSKNPIFNEMDRDDEWKFQEDILDNFQYCKLPCIPELMELYLWKTGCNDELLYDLSEDETVNNLKLSSFGNYASFIESTSMFVEDQLLDMRFANDKMLSFLFSGSIEYPILIDLDSNRETFKSLFLYWPELTHSEKPVMIYDSLSTWMRTIIECYKRGVYSIDAQGHLVSNLLEEYLLSKEINTKSGYWSLYV